MDALINDEFERLYQQMIARKAATCVESNTAEFLLKANEADEMQNNFTENSIEFSVPSDPLVQSSEIASPKQFHERENKREYKKSKKHIRTEKPVPPSPDSAASPSDPIPPPSAALAKKKKSASLVKSPSEPPQPKRKSSTTDASHSAQAGAFPPAPPVIQDSDSNTPPWIRAPSNPELVWPTATISEVKGEGILTFRPCPSRAKFVFRGSLYHPDAFKALMKASIDLDGLWRYHLLQQSHPRDTSSMLIRRGLHPLFLRRCLRKNASQSNRYTSVATDATDEPTSQHYVLTPSGKTSTTQEKEQAPLRAKKKTLSKATKSSQGSRTQKSSATTAKTAKKHSAFPLPPMTIPSLPSSSIPRTPSVPAACSSTKARSRSLLAGTLPLPTVDSSRNTAIRSADENTRLPIGSPQITSSGPVVHTPPVKRIKK